MMTIKKITSACAEARQVPQMMKDNGVEYHEVKCVNWADEYPYCPQFDVALAHDADNIYIHYRVTEQSVRAVAEKDQDAVWQDSCVEFFSKPIADGDIYYNVECNCTGKILLAAGPVRENRERAPQEVTASIKRWASLGAEPFEERMGETLWEVALIIPRTVYFKQDIKTLDGLHASANIYKCGDKLTVPHFVSLYPINAPKPDFHRPDYFQAVTFE